MLNRLLLRSSCILLLLAIFSVGTSAQVVVIPLMGSDTVSIQNVVTVAKSGGDFTDPVTAMDSISGADENNRYLLLIAPGVYPMTEALVMKPYVDVVGSGQNATKLVGDYGSTNDGSSAIVSIEVNNTSIRGMTVQNTGGGGAYVFGIHTNGLNVGNLQTTISEVAVDVSGATLTNRGIFIGQNSELVLKSIRVNVFDDDDSTYGIYNSGTMQTISDANITVSGTAAFARIGIYNGNGNSRIRLINSSVTASGGNSPDAISAFNGASISHSVLDGDIVGTAQCSFAFMVNEDLLDASCAELP